MTGEPGVPEKEGLDSRSPEDLVRLHLRWGWWSLLVFLVLGGILEGLHGFKVSAYLEVSKSTRRLMWTLAHAHGTLLGLMHLGLAATLRETLNWSDRSRQLASRCLLGAGILLPGGFFFGGVFIHDGDPGVAIFLVPVGALLLCVAVLLTARSVGRR